MDNSFYQTGSELSDQAEEAFEMGDYDAAADLAAQAEEYFLRSDEYVATMLLYQSAQDDLALADERFAYALSIGADVHYPNEYESASESLEAARAAMEAEDYALASERAKAAMASLEGIRETMPLPAKYLVQFLPDSRDCLWRIAGLPWAYNDSFQWTKLYDANKKNLPDPNNPNLILPGQMIQIPSLFGEKREGQYDSSKTYETFKKPAAKK